MNGILLHKFSNHDILRQYGKGLIIDLNGKRRVLSTSMLNGGISDNLSHVFNFNCLADDYDCYLHYDTYEDELKANALTLGLSPEKSTGISTAAFVECAAICTKEYKNLSVTAIVTAGVDHNAVRIGDPASYHEESGIYTPLSPGTINILLYINHAMPHGALIRAVTMCTEAKTAALQELMLGSCYSCGIATGSGTDGTIIVCDMESSSLLTDAGGHSKLGELIGQSVKTAVKEALNNQTSASSARQHSILERGRRFGICLSSLWSHYQTHFMGNECIHLSIFEHKLYEMHQNSNAVVFSSLYFHMLDQYQWKLLEWPEILREAKSLCSWFLTTNHLSLDFLFHISYTTDQPLEDLLSLYQTAIITYLIH